MKKVSVLLLSLCMLFGLAACGTDAEQTTKGGEFVAGEKLESLMELPISFPCEKDAKATIRGLVVTKSEVLDPNELSDYFYDTWGEYTFYRYKYTVTVTGAADAYFAGKYMRLKLHFPEGSLSATTYFDGNLLETENISGSYFESIDKTVLSGCVFKVQSDGSFSAEFVGYSNNHLEEYIITQISVIS